MPTRQTPAQARRIVQAAHRVQGPSFRYDGATWTISAYLTRCNDPRVQAPLSSILPGIYRQPLCWTGTVASRNACYFLGQYATADDVLAAAQVALDAAAARRRMAADSGALLAGSHAEQRAAR